MKFDLCYSKKCGSFKDRLNDVIHVIIWNILQNVNLLAAGRTFSFAVVSKCMVDAYAIKLSISLPKYAQF